MSDQNGHSAPSRPRRKRKNYSLLILAAGIFLFGAAAGTLYYRAAAGHLADRRRSSRKRRPETGPADGADLRARRQRDPAVADCNPGRGREHRAVHRRQDRPCGGARRSEPAGQCRIRRHPAQERRRAVGAFRHCAEGLEENADAEDQEPRRTRRPPRRRHRTHAGQRHAAARDPDRSRRQSRQGDDHPVRHQPDRRDGARPELSTRS